MKLVLVEWEDACTLDDSPWVHIKGATPPVPKVFKQVGWLVSIDHLAIILTQAADAETMAARDRIPAGMVRSIVELSTEGKPVPVPKAPGRKPLAKNRSR